MFVVSGQPKLVIWLSFPDFEHPLFLTPYDMQFVLKSQSDIFIGKVKAENEILKKWYAGHYKSFSNVVAHRSTIEH